MHCFSEDKTSDCCLGLYYLGFIFPFVKKKSYQQDITAFKTPGNAFVSLNLLVENISHFLCSCDQNLICTSQVLSVSNPNRHKEILEAVTLADVFAKHSLEQTWWWGKGEENLILSSLGEALSLCSVYIKCKHRTGSGLRLVFLGVTAVQMK